MQTITVQHEPNAVVLGIPDFGPTLYADDPGKDHPTPPAPDREKAGGKAKPKRKPAPKAKKKKKR
jgi:hypothetical protein